MRGDFILKILETLEGGIGDMVDLFLAYLGAGYGASYKKLDYERRAIRGARIKLMSEIKSSIQSKIKFYKFLSKLKHEGFIERRGEKASPRFYLTEKGKGKLSTLQTRRVMKKVYKKESGDTLIIVAFDIPEKQRIQRNWLREVLKNLNFQMIQKSVWLGKTKIPKSLIKDIRNLKLIDFIEIFAVRKRGTLEQVI